MKTYFFWVKLTHDGLTKQVIIEAVDSVAAIAKLPECVSWNFMGNQDD